jgi:hypothetical protein
MGAEMAPRFAGSLLEISFLRPDSMVPLLPVLIHKMLDPGVRATTTDKIIPAKRKVHARLLRNAYDPEST